MKFLSKLSICKCWRLNVSTYPEDGSNLLSLQPLCRIDVMSIPDVAAISRKFLLGGHDDEIRSMGIIISQEATAYRRKMKDLAKIAHSLVINSREGS